MAVTLLFGIIICSFVESSIIILCYSSAAPATIFPIVCNVTRKVYFQYGVRCAIVIITMIIIITVAIMLAVCVGSHFSSTRLRRNECA